MSIIITYTETTEAASSEQFSARQQYIQDQVAAGTTDGVGAKSASTPFGAIRAWTTTEAADAYVAFYNTLFGSKVVQAFVTTVG